MQETWNFLYESLPIRVVFGTGSLQRLPDELDRLGSKRTLLLAGSRKPFIDDLVQRLWDADRPLVPRQHDARADRDCAEGARTGEAMPG